MSPMSLSQKYLPLVWCGRAFASLRIFCCSYLSTRASTLCCSLLTPTHRAHPPAPLAPCSCSPTRSPAHPHRSLPRCWARHTASAGAHGVVVCLRLVPGRAKGTHERGPCWRCSCPEAEINRPRPPFSYVANICFKCFRCFRGMLLVFCMDVAKVDRDIAYFASVLRGMLQAFVQNVSSVSDVCC
jgi:hypothetical protein